MPEANTTPETPAQAETPTVGENNTKLTLKAIVGMNRPINNPRVAEEKRFEAKYCQTVTEFKHVPTMEEGKAALGNFKPSCKDPAAKLEVRSIYLMDMDGRPWKKAAFSDLTELNDKGKPQSVKISDWQR